MEKEISSGAMLGIVLIALAAIIGLGFGVFAIAKGTANTGVTNVQENLEGVSQSSYTDYDQTIVTGQQVKSAYQNFEGKSTAVLIATQAVKDSMSSTGVKIKDGSAGIKEKYKTVDSVPMVEAKGAKSTDASGKAYGDLGWETSNGTAITEAYINYNALLANDQGGYSGSKSNAGVPLIYFDNNCYRAEHGYYTNSGKVGMNNIAGNMSKSGMIEYLPTSARFQAYLIKDASGTTMGIAFEQISSK